AGKKNKVRIFFSDKVNPMFHCLLVIETAGVYVGYLHHFHSPKSLRKMVKLEFHSFHLVFIPIGNTVQKTANSDATQHQSQPFKKGGAGNAIACFPGKCSIRCRKIFE